MSGTSVVVGNYRTHPEQTPDTSSSEGFPSWEDECLTVSPVDHAAA
jgi:hypothetical protein